MRGQTKEYLDGFLTEHPEVKGRLLDIGSLDVSGSIKEVVEKHGLTYLGVDMRSGNGVDIVANAHDLNGLVDPGFDIITCFDTLEHDDAFWLTVAEMKRLVKTGGWLMFGVPSRNCPYHEHPHDYWRFMSDCMKEVFLKGYLFIDTRIDRGNDMEDEIYGWGQKP